jgi:hypothetical protein
MRTETAEQRHLAKSSLEGCQGQKSERSFKGVEVVDEGEGRKMRNEDGG